MLVSSPIDTSLDRIASEERFVSARSAASGKPVFRSFAKQEVQA